MTITEVALSHSGKTAFLTESNEDISYDQLQDDVRNFSKLFPERELVFIVCGNDYSTVSFYLACLDSGAVPLLLSSSVSPQVFWNLYNIYEPTSVFMPHNFLELSGEFECFFQFRGYSFHKCSIRPGPSLNSDLALLLTTSGSTGSPKLVRLSQKNLLSNALSISKYLEITSEDRAITSLPFNYSYGLSVINSHLVTGGAVLLNGRTLFDPPFWEQLRSQKATSFAGVPYSYDILLRLGFQNMDLPTLRTMTQAGGRMDPKQAEKIYTICESKGMKFITMYGQTEATARIAYLPMTDFERKIGSIGGPIPGGILWIEDELGNIVKEPNVVGELVYSGSNVGLGYAEKKEDLLRGDDWNGVLHTGDLAIMDWDSFYYIQGRKKRFLKLFGVRIDLDAIESWFMERGLVAAAHGTDEYLTVHIEGDEPDAGYRYRTELSSVMQISHSAVNIKVLPLLPRLESGKVDYSCLQ